MRTSRALLAYAAALATLSKSITVTEHPSASDAELMFWRSLPKGRKRRKPGIAWHLDPNRGDMREDGAAPTRRRWQQNAIALKACHARQRRLAASRFG